MGRVTLIARLIARDLRRRPVIAALQVLVISAHSTPGARERSPVVG
jgi:hypothetical protein